MKTDFVHYKLVSKDHPLSLRLETKHTKRKNLLFEDPKTGKTRALRYASNKESIFEDEQQGEVILPSIYFEDGGLSVPKKGAGLTLNKFLSFHPDNVKNGGSVFKMIDFEAEALEAEKMMDIEDKARDVARSLTPEQARAVHRIFFHKTDELSGAEIRLDIRYKAKSDPETFLQYVDAPETEHNNTLKTALDVEIIKFRKNNSELFYNLKDDKSMICRVPVGEDHMKAVSEFLLSKDGLEHLANIEKALEEL